MQLKGLFKRFRKEVSYIKKRKWGYREVGEFWDSVYDYEQIDDKTYAYPRRFEDSFELSNLKDQGYVLDICCRPGNGTVFFHKKGKISNVICADVSQEFLNICGNKLENNKIDNYKLLKFTDLPLPLKDNTFDSVLCFETVEHFSNPGKFIKEIARVCKRSGQIIITTPNILWEPIHWVVAVLNIHHSEGPHRFLRRKKLIKYIHDAGLKIKKEQTTVLIAQGPRFITKIGEFLEKLFKNNLMQLIGLRRIFICEKI